MSGHSSNLVLNANNITGIDQLVREYLLAKGYTKALEAMDSAEKLKKQRPEDMYIPVYDSTNTTAGESKPMDIDDTTDSPSTSTTTTTASKPVSVPTKVAVESLLHNAATSLYVLGVKEGDPKVFLEEYGQFHDWTSQSIDIVNPYLEAIGFAVFITW